MFILFINTAVDQQTLTYWDSLFFFLSTMPDEQIFGKPVWKHKLSLPFCLVTLMVWKLHLSPWRSLVISSHKWLAFSHSLAFMVFLSAFCIFPSNHCSSFFICGTRSMAKTCRRSATNAVGVLRNAGSCIKMKVLRERCMPVEPRQHERFDTMETADPQVSQEWDVTMSNYRSSDPQSSTDPTLDCSPMTNRTEATVCNGNGPVGSRSRVSRL